MNVTVLVAHEVEVGQGNGNRFCADAKKTTNVDNCLAAGARTVDMIDLADLVVVGAVNGSAFQNGGSELAGRETNVIAVIH